ncbi:hypothetical protein HLB23_28375 [Nocardia uniformis]|uniref:Uncharacterized protein n=1 Tax=Nocardia uniformis TaxID=53432 RepID=A0A849C4V1_9NOCA|nr:hypothetical protein [Nocardia uniformis]NNH73724.1 hypothetical protein [Nocardia uniformis]
MTSYNPHPADNPPTITAADIIGGREQINRATLYAERHGVQLRFVLYVDSYRAQSRFTVEAFSRPELSWNLLWSIIPGTYAYQDGPDTAAVTDPATNLIASPYSLTAEIKASSWQKIINALTTHADRLLS